MEVLYLKHVNIGDVCLWKFVSYIACVYAFINEFMMCWGIICDELDIESLTRLTKWNCFCRGYSF